MLYEDIDNLIGDTPLVKFNEYNNNLYLKSDGTIGLHFISIEFLIAFTFTIILTSIMDLKHILLGI